MAENNPSGGAEPKPVGADLIIPVAAIIFTIYYISTIIGMKWEAQVSAFLVGGILFFLCTIFLIKTFFEVRSGKATLSFEALVNPISVIPKRVMLFGLTLLYILFLFRMVGSPLLHSRSCRWRCWCCRIGRTNGSSLACQQP